MPYDPNATAFKLSKPQLNAISTVLGIIAGISTVLLTNQVGNPKVVGSVGGCATVLLGYLTQKPATKSPTTEEVEDELTGKS